MKSMTPYGLIDPYGRAALVLKQRWTIEHFHGHARTITRRGVARPSLPSSMNLSTSSPSDARSEEHTSELQSLMRISYAVFCLKKKNTKKQQQTDIKLRKNKERTTT